MSSTKIGSASVAVDSNEWIHTFPEGGWGSTWVFCDSGWSASGGGFYLNDKVPRDDSLMRSVIVTQSGPYGQNGWIVTAHELQEDAIPNELVVYVMCVKNVP